MAAPPPPISLPPQINAPTLIPLPPMPANPPTADHCRAAGYVRRVENAKAVGQATNTQLHEAYQYLSLVDAALNLPAALQLPTVQPALQATMQAALQATLPAALQAALPAALQAAVPAALAELYIMAAQNHNRQVIDGISIPFREVRYPNGNRPTQNPHNLTFLDSTTTINGLGPGEMVAYINGYMPNNVVPQNRAARIRLIKLAIGCPID